MSEDNQQQQLTGDFIARALQELGDAITNLNMRVAFSDAYAFAMARHLVSDEQREAVIRDAKVFSQAVRSGAIIHVPKFLDCKNDISECIEETAESTALVQQAMEEAHEGEELEEGVCRSGDCDSPAACTRAQECLAPTPTVN